MSAGRSEIKSGYSGGGKKLGTMVCEISGYVVLDRKKSGYNGWGKIWVQWVWGRNVFIPS